MTRPISWLGLALASLSLSACVSFGGKPPTALLVLSSVEKVKDGAVLSGDASSALIVLLPQVPRQLDTNRVPVKSSDSSIAYIKNAFWADKPSRLMQQLLMETVAAKNGQLVLNEVDAAGKATQFLSGSLIEFTVDARSMQAVIVYDAVKLVKGQVVQKRRFEVTEPLSLIDAASAGVALNIAANRIASDMSLWLKPTIEAVPVPAPIAK
jgi:cholesterol transport system auxiliary component